MNNEYEYLDYMSDEECKELHYDTLADEYYEEKLKKEKIQVIELNKIDELLEDFKQFKHKNEKFSDFIRVSKCIDENLEDFVIFDWNYVERQNLIEVKDENAQK